MTKQEEIKEGIFKIIADNEEPDGVDANMAVAQILTYLHSQGVVLKVDRELPDETLLGITHQQARRVLNAGYEAIVPLIL